MVMSNLACLFFFFLCLALTEMYVFFSAGFLSGGLTGRNFLHEEVSFYFSTLKTLKKTRHETMETVRERSSELTYACVDLELELTYEPLIMTHTRRFRLLHTLSLSKTESGLNFFENTKIK